MFRGFQFGHPFTQAVQLYQELLSRLFVASLHLLRSRYDRGYGLCPIAKAMNNRSVSMMLCPMTFSPKVSTPRTIGMISGAHQRVKSMSHT